MLPTWIFVAACVAVYYQPSNALPAQVMSLDSGDLQESLRAALKESERQSLSIIAKRRNLEAEKSNIAGGNDRPVITTNYRIAHITDDRPPLRLVRYDYK